MTPTPAAFIRFTLRNNAVFSLSVREDVGSSKTRTLAPSAIPRAISTICCCAIGREATRSPGEAGHSSCSRTFSDRVLVMRDGKPTGDFITKEINLDTIVNSMIGRSLGNYYFKGRGQIKEEVLRVENLSARGYFKEVSFCVHAGEVLGFYGLVGAGRTEIMESIFGVRKLESGKIYLNGKEIKIRSSKDAIKNKIGFLTENRKEQGLVLKQSCRENIAMANLPNMMKHGLVDNTATLQLYEKYHELLKISSTGPEQTVGNLSGGNQQKVVVGKWMAIGPQLLILDEPTRGIDVGSKSEIYRLIAQMADSGMAIILISSEMPEIMGVSNRVITMAQGQLTKELTADDVTEESLMRSILITDSAQRA